MVIAADLGKLPCNSGIAVLLICRAEKADIPEFKIYPER